MSSKNLSPGSPDTPFLPIKQGSGTIWTPTPTRPSPPFFYEKSSPLCEPLSPQPSGRSRSGRSRSNAFSLPGKLASVSFSAKRAYRPSDSWATKARVGHDLSNLFDEDEDTLGLDGEVVLPPAKKVKVGHVFSDEEYPVEEDGFPEEEEDLLEDGEDILDEEEGHADTTSTLLQARRAAAEQLGLTDEMERGDSWGSMFLTRCVGERGLKDDLVRFIDEQKGRLVGQSLEPIESSIQARHRTAWPTHCKEVDEHWNPFVDNVVQLAQGKLTPSRDFSKPSGPRNARLYVVWHYPTYTVEVTEWGMISSRKNPSIGQQVRKIGFPQDVCTDDLIPIRSKDGTSDQDRFDMWPNFQLVKEACIKRIWENLEHQRFAVLMGGSVVDTIGASVPNKYTQHIMYLKFSVPFLGRRQPFFWILKDSRTHKIELVLFCCWHLAFFQPRFGTPMEYRLCGDLLWNAICEFSGVPVADPTFFQDRAPQRAKAFKTEVNGAPRRATALKTGVLGDPRSHFSAYSTRRRKFQDLTAEEQDVILQSLELEGQTPEDYFGGWSVEQVVDEEAGREASSIRRAEAVTRVGLPSADLPDKNVASRRSRFRKLDSARQEIYVKRITDGGETPESYFGGQSLDKVRNPWTFDKDVNAHVQGARRTRFRSLSAAQQEELLQNISDIDETPEAYFGAGWSVDRVRIKYDFGEVSKETLQSRRSDFRRRTPANQQKFLEEISELGKKPEDFFGGWSAERVLGKWDFGDVGINTWWGRRVAFRNKTPAERQVLLKEIEDAGKTPEDFFGGWNVDRVLSKIDFGVDNPNALKSRRATFKKNSEAKRQETLKNIEDAGKTPEDFFGKGYTIDRVLTGKK